MGEAVISEYAPPCSVVICTRNRPELLDRALGAVSRLTYPRANVLVVENAPVDDRTREVAARWGVRYLVEPVPGLSRARNCGARACDSEIVAYLDDDAVAEPDWLTALECEFRDPQVMAAAGRVVALRLETEAERVNDLVRGADARGLERRVVDKQTPGWFELANFGGIAHGTNMAFRRTAFEVWPGFDERIGAGTSLHSAPEEHHAFFALVDRGYRVVYTPYAVVRHPYAPTMPELRTRYLRELAATTSYVTLLLVEEPRYWGSTLRYVAGRIGRNLARLGRRERTAMPRLLSRRRVLLAWLTGPLLYLRARFQRTP